MHPKTEGNWDQEGPFSSLKQVGGGNKNHKTSPLAPTLMSYYVGYGFFFAIYMDANTRAKSMLLFNEMAYREIRSRFPSLTAFKDK